MLEAAIYLYKSLADMVVFIVIINAIVSWLVAFDVVNIRNPNINRMVRTLDSAARPVLMPFQRFIPTLGGVDISPIILFILINTSYVLIRGVTGIEPHGFFG